MNIYLNYNNRILNSPTKLSFGWRAETHEKLSEEALADSDIKNKDDEFFKEIIKENSLFDEKCNKHKKLYYNHFYDTENKEKNNSLNGYLVNFKKAWEVEDKGKRAIYLGRALHYLQDSLCRVHCKYGENRKLHSLYEKEAISALKKNKNSSNTGKSSVNIPMTGVYFNKELCQKAKDIQTDEATVVNNANTQKSELIKYINENNSNLNNAYYNIQWILADLKHVRISRDIAEVKDIVEDKTNNLIINRRNNFTLEEVNKLPKRERNQIFDDIVKNDKVKLERKETVNENIKQIKEIINKALGNNDDELLDEICKTIDKFDNRNTKFFTASERRMKNYIERNLDQIAPEELNKILDKIEERNATNDEEFPQIVKLNKKLKNEIDGNNTNKTNINEARNEASEYIISKLDDNRLIKEIFKTMPNSKKKNLGNIEKSLKEKEDYIKTALNRVKKGDTSDELLNDIYNKIEEIQPYEVREIVQLENKKLYLIKNYLYSDRCDFELRYEDNNLNELKNENIKKRTKRHYSKINENLALTEQMTKDFWEVVAKKLEDERLEKEAKNKT